MHFEEADEITIEGDSCDVILDGETFRAERGQADQPAARASRCRSSSWRLKARSHDASFAPRRRGTGLAGRSARERDGRGDRGKHGAASRAVLFYGSCLREKQLDGLMLDFYLIVSDYRAAYAKRWLAAANRLIPPNVFYFEQDGLAAKYAVLSESGLPPAQRSRDAQRFGLGAVRAAGAAGVGGGRAGARSGRSTRSAARHRLCLRPPGDAPARSRWTGGGARSR